ncbi:hypothetical protein DNTS_029355 [Danionella cerebrum]|uniref:ADP-ribosylation factor-like protein 8A n=1 Tax=Danionella cerebrum TaxID=2873325 RepID=A0A553Q7W4_9TELE|nr:hypothetical protein DNTS_029355 [Danionella translucida]
MFGSAVRGCETPPNKEERSVSTEQQQPPPPLPKPRAPEIAVRMIALFNKLLDWFKALFWKEEMELTLVGLQYSGKTTFVNVIAVTETSRRTAGREGPDRVHIRVGSSRNRGREREGDSSSRGSVAAALISKLRSIGAQGHSPPEPGVSDSVSHKAAITHRFSRESHSGQFSEDMIPTVGFNMRKITKGNVTIKLWDIGGQPRFRSMWERYCRGVSAIVYMVDAADPEKIEASKNELHNLLDKPQLQGIPVLVLGNKRDLPGALDEKELIERMNLSAIQDREICCYSISCKEKDNIGELCLIYTALTSAGALRLATCEVGGACGHHTTVADPALADPAELNMRHVIGRAASCDQLMNSEGVLVGEQHGRGGSLSPTGEESGSEASPSDVFNEHFCGIPNILWKKNAFCPGIMMRSRSSSLPETRHGAGDGRGGSAGQRIRLPRLVPEARGEVSHNKHEPENNRNGTGGFPSLCCREYSARAPAGLRIPESEHVI